MQPPDASPFSVSQISAKAPSHIFLTHDLWGIIISFLPVSSLCRFARVASFLRARVDHESHWRSRLRRLGVLDIFETHPARALFLVDGNIVDWREYFIAYYMLARNWTREIHPGADLITFHPNDELLRQFPDFINRPDTQVVFMEVSKPYYPNYTARCSQDGEEKGAFLLGNGTWHFHYHYRVDWHSQDDHYSQNVDFSAPNLRAFKSEFLMGGAYLPLRLSRGDVAYHLLDGISSVHKSNLSHLPVVEAYRSQLALRKKRVITVAWGDQQRKIPVKTAFVPKLLAEINSAFNIDQSQYSLIRATSLYRYAGASREYKTFPRETGQLEDGQFWQAHVEPLAKESLTGGRQRSRAKK